MDAFPCLGSSAQFDVLDIVEVDGDIFELEEPEGREYFVKDAGAGFQGNTNVITMITQDSVTQLPLMDKEEAAHAILTEILARR